MRWCVCVCVCVRVNVQESLNKRNLCDQMLDWFCLINFI